MTIVKPELLLKCISHFKVSCHNPTFVSGFKAVMPIHRQYNKYKQGKCANEAGCKYGGIF